jgi:TPR repeat protein
LQQAIAAGDVEWSALSLGDLYQADTPLKDAGKAVAAYQQAVDAGNTIAMQTLAALLTSHESASADLARARDLLETFVSQKPSADAELQLARIYLRSNSPIRNVGKARKYMEMAASAGSIDAHLALAALASALPSNGKDIAVAVAHVRAAASIGGKKIVSRALMELPASSLVAIVQSVLLDMGEPIKVTGRHAKQTETAIADVCAKEHISDCNPKLITQAFLETVVLR